MFESVTKMDGETKRHCWECRRRCLVCDFARPACKRCLASGVPCPGYGATKPQRITWLAPGAISGRGQRRGKIPSKQRSKGVEAVDSGIVVPKRDASETPDIKHLPWFGTDHEVCAILEAVAFFNGFIYQDLLPLHQLGPQRFVFPITPSHMKHAFTLPLHLKLNLVCMTLSYRLNRCSDPYHRLTLSADFYKHRGIAIRSLSRTIAEDRMQKNDMVLAGIMQLLLVDIQHGASKGWHSHLTGLEKLITLRGGITELWQSKALESLILCFITAGVLGNTTSPSADLTMTDLHIDCISLVLEQYDTSQSAVLIIPPRLFVEIININRLRCLATWPSGAERSRLSQETYGILKRIAYFSPKEFAATKASAYEEWKLLGQVHQSAAAIYCISSLQSGGVLPFTMSLRSRCAANAQTLEALFHRALECRALKGFMIWPLVVLGVEAVHGKESTRTFVKQTLSEMSHYCGTSVPKQAKEVLERFWTLGDMRWDAAFDMPYAFLMQVAIDLSGIEM